MSKTSDSEGSVFPNTLPIQQQKRSHDWMMTFSDLLSLLLAFFIMAYAMSAVKESDWKEITKVMGKTFNERRLIDQLISYTAPFGIGTIKVKQLVNLDYLYTIIAKKVINDEFLQQVITLENNSDHLVISISGQAAFEPFSNRLSVDSQVILFTLSESIKLISNRIEIATYVDAKNPITGSVKMDWQLAMERVITVVNELRRMGNNNMMNAVVRHVNHQEIADETSYEALFMPAMTDRVDIIISYKFADEVL